MVAIYIRVSTLEQANEGYSIAAQREKLTAYCKAKGWSIYDIYIDAGFSGANLNRPSLQRMLKDLNKIDAILVYKLDRLSRRQKDTLYLIEEKFLVNNIDFISLSESFDTTTPFGKAMIGILSVFAQLERETIKERTRLGKEKRAKEGLWRGGGNVPIGYEFVNDRLVINEYEAMKVKEIFKLYNEGLSLQEIATQFNNKGYNTNKGKRWTSTQVSRVLKNKTYAGYIEYNNEFYQGIHTPIIDENIFNETQIILDKKKKKKITKSKYLLGGLLWCGYCGARLKSSWSSTSKNGTKFYYYVCYSRANNPAHMVKSPDCPAKFWQMKQLDDIVVAKLLKLPLNPDKIAKIYKLENNSTPSFEDVDLLNNKVKNIDKQISLLLDLYQTGNMKINTITNRIEALNCEKEKIKSNISYLKSQSIEPLTEIPLKKILSYINDFSLIWSEATFDEKRIILTDFINRIVVKNDNIEIEWKNS